jgi:hypothetical protein
MAEKVPQFESRERMASAGLRHSYLRLACEWGQGRGSEPELPGVQVHGSKIPPPLPFLNSLEESQRDRVVVQFANRFLSRRFFRCVATWPMLKRSSKKKGINETAFSIVQQATQIVPTLLVFPEDVHW